MTKRIAILHYASPPVIGGVESVIAHHASGLTDLGYMVRVISGYGDVFDERVELHVNPLFGSRDPQVLTIKQELDGGIVSDAFHHLVDQQEHNLRQALAGCDICIVHNVHTLNKNLPLTAALHRFSELRIIAWCHDLAWTNDQYQAELYEGYPWNLLKQAWANTRYVTISVARQLEIARLFNITPETVLVVTAGVDIPTLFQWTDACRLIESKLHLLDADLLFLLPARLTRRKNIGLGLQILHELKKQDHRDCRLIVSGPPGPHNPSNPGYLGELLEIRNRLGLQNSAHFLYELEEPPLVPDDATMANLYQVADALLFPSLQEGFGIPILEAGLVGLPIFCSDLEPFHETGQSDVVFFQPTQDSPENIATMIRTYFTGNPRQRLKTRVRQQYRWDSIIRRQLIPLLEVS